MTKPLRQPKIGQPRKSPEAARAKGIFINAFTIQSNHLHLLAEAAGPTAMKRGMKAFTATIVYYVKELGILHRGIQFFRDRYHVAYKRKVREVVNAVRYILSNTFKHSRKLFCNYTFTFQSSPNDELETHILSPPRFHNTRQAFHSGNWRQA